MNLLPIIMIALPVLACALISLGMPARKTALATTILNAVLGLDLALSLNSNAGMHFETNTVWFVLPEWFRVHFHFGVDGLNLSLVLLTVLVSLAAVAVTKRDIYRPKLFYTCLLLISTGALGAFLSLDILFFFIFHELALVPTLLLVGMWGTGDHVRAAWRMTVYLGAGSLVLLIGLLALCFAVPAQTTDLAGLASFLNAYPLPSFAQPVLAGVMIIGFGALASLWPFHSWAPQGYACAPAPAAMLHAGVLKNFGVYGLLRIVAPFLPDGLLFWKDALIVLLLFNILYMGMVTIAQKNLNAMLGCSSVMHVGYLFLGLVSFEIAGWTGVVVLMAGHGLATALLFGLSEEIRQRQGTLVFSEMKGLGTKTPTLMFFFLLGSLAAMGLPGLANFSGEILIFFGTWKSQPVAVVLALFGILISAVYFLRAVRRIFFGEPIAQPTRDIALNWPYVLLSTGIVILGVYPRLLTKWIEPVLEAWKGAGL